VIGAQASWESSVAGLDAPDDSETGAINDAAAELRGMMERGEHEAAGEFLIRLLLRLDANGRPVFDRRRLTTFAMCYGGADQFARDLRVFSSRRTIYSVPAMELLRRLGREPREAREARDALLARGDAARVINEEILRPAAEIVGGVVVFRALAAIKKWNKETADALADDGHWFLAGLLATVDFFIPETGVDVALSIVPITGGALVVSQVARAMQARFPAIATRCSQIVAVLTKDLAPDIRRLWDRAAAGDAAALGRLAEIDEQAARMPSYGAVEVPILDETTLKPIRRIRGQEAKAALPPSPHEILTGGKARSSVGSMDETERAATLAISRARAEEWRRLLRPSPRKGAPTVEWSELANGEVVQIVRGPIAKNSAKRTEFPDMDPVAGFDRGHLIPHVLDGDTARYNAVYMPPRLNRGLVGWIDRLASRDLRGATLEVRVVFSNWDNALRRWPKPGMDAFQFTFQQPGRKPSVLQLPWGYTDAEFLKLGSILVALRKALARAAPIGGPPVKGAGRTALARIAKHFRETPFE
jgi:hypothetical protein